jgi:hypothetical protein
VKNFNRHMVNGFLLGAMWAPLLWLVTVLAGRYAPHTAVWQLAWWEIGLVLAGIALPAQAMRALNLNPVTDAGERQGRKPLAK